MTHLEPTIGGSDLQVQHRWIEARDILGIYLGDLRELVSQCEDLSDEAIVTRGRKTAEHAKYADERYIFELNVRDETLT